MILQKKILDQKQWMTYTDISLPCSLLLALKQKKGIFYMKIYNPRLHYSAAVGEEQV